MTEVSQHVSTRTRLHFCMRIRMLALIGVCMAPCLMSYAQTQVYADYPQTRGKVEPWKQEDFPSWLSLDGQIRLRTEDFTSYQYIPRQRPSLRVDARYTADSLSGRLPTSPAICSSLMRTL